MPQPPEACPPHLEVFVYGTLKRGQVNHELFCRGAREVEAAFTYGRLFHLPAGYPALTIPPHAVLAPATGSLAADLALQRAWTERLSREAVSDGDLESDPPDPIVVGEWMLFDDPEVRLPRLDRLEAFRPGRRSLYERVLIRVWSGDEREARAAWTYVQTRPRGIPVHSGEWPL